MAELMRRASVRADPCLSPARLALDAARLPLQPSCSVYALEALRLHGPVKGSWLAARGFRAAIPSPGSAVRRASIPFLFQSTATSMNNKQERHSGHRAGGAVLVMLAIFRGRARDEGRAGAPGRP